MSAPRTKGSPQWASFFAWLAVYLVISGCVTFLLFAWLERNVGHQPPLDSTILLAKAVSLVARVMIGGAEITRAHECPWQLKALTAAVMTYAGVVALLLVVKIVVTEFVALEIGNKWFTFGSTYRFIRSYGDYLAVSPLLIYATMNGATALYGKFQQKDDLQREALSYFVVADIPCLVPIISVFVLVGSIRGNLVHDDDAARIFVSGAMAMFIVTSNILTLVVRYVVHPSLDLAEPCSLGATANVGNDVSSNIGEPQAENPTGPDHVGQGDPYGN
jgi:hypothetical protein